MLPASYGDCLRLSYGPCSAPHHILIDAGTRNAWTSGIAQRIPGNAHFDLFVLTHIDADHIGGAIALLDDRRDVSFGDVWFNGWKHLPKRLLSAKQGEVFSTLLVDRQLPWNKAFDERAVALSGGELPVITTLPGDLSLTLLSPTTAALERLARVWKRSIQRSGLVPGHHRSYRQFLARSPTTSTDVDMLAETSFRRDASVPNGSSIAFLAEYTEGEERFSVLFAGDAHAHTLCHSIRELLSRRELDRLPLDALKVSHHGSRGNLNQALMQLIDCPRYLISGNGAVHNLPDNEAIARIIKYGGEKPALHFNYESERTEVWRKEQLKERYGYSAAYGDGGHHSIELC